MVDSAPKPGVTRLLKWVRLGGELDMLDAPGVIPAAFNDQVGREVWESMVECEESVGYKNGISSLLIGRLNLLA